MNNKIKYIGITIIGIILALVLAFITNKWLETNSAKDNLNNITNSSGTITAYNNKILLFTDGQKIENTNIEQKALGVNNTATTPASFIFSNGKNNENKKQVKAYLDFSEQRSRDFILMNQDLLKNMIQAGTIDLKIYSIPTGNGFSIFSSEALAEAFVTYPDKSWNYFISLMKASAELENNVSADEIVEKIVDLAKENKIDSISEESIHNGTFSSWILSVSDDPFLKTGTLLPEVFAGETPLADIININDSDELREAIVGEN